MAKRQLNKLILLAILLIAAFLRLYKISSLFPFNGDVAWDYLSALNFWENGKIPLIGISSSVPWLHQGTFFTYFLIIILKLFGLNPVFPAIIVGVIGVFTTFLVYQVGKIIFSQKAGLVAAIIYATLPLIVFFERLPYHLSLISLFTLLFFLSLHKALSGNTKIFMISALLMGILMQLELSNLVLIPILFWVFIENKKNISIKLLTLSGLAFLIPWIPKVVYDISNGFTQTLGFIAWIIHKIIPISGFDLQSGFNNFNIWIIFAIFTFLLLIYFYFRNIKCKLSTNIHVLILFIAFPVFGLLVFGNFSKSYLPVLFPIVSLSLGIIIEKLMYKDCLKPIIVTGLLIMTIFNANYLIKNNFMVGNDQYSYWKNAANFITKDAKGFKYNLIPMGSYSDFPNNKLNLIYLTKIMGNEPSIKKENLIYFVNYNGRSYNLKKIAQFGNIIISKK